MFIHIFFACRTCGAGTGVVKISVYNGGSTVFNQAYSFSNVGCGMGAINAVVSSTYCISGYLVKFQCNENTGISYPASVTSTADLNDGNHLTIELIG